MIIVVEGPSAAGKSTWIAATSPEFLVPEHHLEGPSQESSDAEAATYWADANSCRWQEALAVERHHGVAVCDTDPLKLHYDYCLARVGLASYGRFDVGVVACKSELASERLGIADLVLCRVPDDATLVRQRMADTTRRRHRFELHRGLAESLRDWYAALDAADPGRVRWSFPPALPSGQISRPRYDVSLFDDWMSRLPR